MPSTCLYCNVAVHRLMHGFNQYDPKTRKTKDHYYPQHIAGTDEVVNGMVNKVIACEECNQVKGHNPPEIFLVFVKAYKGTDQFTRRHFDKFCYMLALAGLRLITKEIKSRKRPKNIGSAPAMSKGRFTKKSLRRKM